VQPDSVSPDYLTLKINPSEEILNPELPDYRFRALAGLNAENCGHVKIKESRAKATACARGAVKHHKPFYVIYDEAGIDSIIAGGMAGNSDGKLYSITFDSMGMSDDHLPPGSTMPDGFHTLVIPCSQPVRVRVTRTGQLTCFAGGSWVKKDD
jgi:hypothetical protein